MWLKTDLLVGNSGALDIFCLIKRSKTRACMRILLVFASNCRYLSDSTGILRANCGLARRRKSTNFTYTRVVSTTSVAQAQFWSKQRIRANPGNTCELGAIDGAKRVAQYRLFPQVYSTDFATRGDSSEKCANPSKVRKFQNSAQRHHKTRKQAFEQKKMRKQRFRIERLWFSWRSFRNAPDLFLSP